jgi:hypothetical protein
VTFANGEMQTLTTNESIPAGMSSRTYDLTGYERRISRIDLVYKSRKAWKYNEHAQLTVYGLS